MDDFEYLDQFVAAGGADLVDCMVALPGQLFYSTQIPACLWFLARDRRNGIGAGGEAAGLRRDRGTQAKGFAHALRRAPHDAKVVRARAVVGLGPP